MKKWIPFLLTAVVCVGCGRHVRIAEDITPGNFKGEKMDWRYGASDIRVQTTKVTQQLMDRWYTRTGSEHGQKPRLVISGIDNRTNQYISTDMIRDIFEGAAASDGRFSVTVGNERDEAELDKIMHKVSQDAAYGKESQKPSKYEKNTRIEARKAKAPEYLAKVRITKSATSDRRYDYEDYRMTVTLYDIETQEVVDSQWDVLRKKVQSR